MDKINTVLLGNLRISQKEDEIMREYRIIEQAETMSMRKS